MVDFAHWNDAATLRRIQQDLDQSNKTIGVAVLAASSLVAPYEGSASKQHLRTLDLSGTIGFGRSS